ncbi:putative transmembrane protein [Toxoplasma gondii RUB]|uniref:Putative transmembrane protein n=1 Tax=Toxoplasma gondii RUB TaxID=935652 RepID=A0A086M320_TOXGO|nr:putative transmembrane protein [Toxoplasma gondii RUB]
MFQLLSGQSPGLISIKDSRAVSSHAPLLSRVTTATTMKSTCAYTGSSGSGTTGGRSCRCRFSPALRLTAQRGSSTAVSKPSAGAVSASSCVSVLSDSSLPSSFSHRRCGSSAVHCSRMSPMAKATPQFAVPASTSLRRRVHRRNLPLYACALVACVMLVGLHSTSHLIGNGDGQLSGFLLPAVEASVRFTSFPSQKALSLRFGDLPLREMVMHFHYTEQLFEDTRELLAKIFNVPVRAISFLQLRQDDGRPEHASLLTFDVQGKHLHDQKGQFQEYLDQSRDGLELHFGGRKVSVEALAEDLPPAVVDEMPEPWGRSFVWQRPGYTRALENVEHFLWVRVKKTSRVPRHVAYGELTQMLSRAIKGVIQATGYLVEADSIQVMSLEEDHSARVISLAMSRHNGMPNYLRALRAWLRNACGRTMILQTALGDALTADCSIPLVTVRATGKPLTEDDITRMEEELARSSVEADEGRAEDDRETKAKSAMSAMSFAPPYFSQNQTDPAMVSPGYPVGYPMGFVPLYGLKPWGASDEGTGSAIGTMKASKTVLQAAAEDEESSGVGVKVGIVVGCLIVGLLIILVVWYAWRRRRKEEKALREKQKANAAERRANRDIARYAHP